MSRISLTSLLCLLVGCGSSDMQKTDVYSRLGPFLEPSIASDRQNPVAINRPDFILNFSFTIDALLYKQSATCQIDSSPPVDCRSGTFVLTGVADGDHTIVVSVIDSLGRRAPTLTTGIRVDTVAPVAQFNMRPGNFTGRTTIFAFTASDAHTGVVGLECSLDNMTFATCESPLTLANLSNGNHSLRVRARDAAGNLSPEALATWTVNNSAPAITIGARPPDNTSSRSANFSFTGLLDGAMVTQFRCSLDNGPFTDCTSPINYTNLADGLHSFRLAGRNHNGEFINPITVNWRVDTDPPSTPRITTNVPALSTTAVAQFMFSADDSGSGIQRYECSLDGNGFSACASPISFSNLAEGNHSFAVRAFDRAGNISVPASFSWAIDLP